MTPKRKIFLSYVLIAFLLINSGAYILLYFSSLKIVKKTVHYLLEENELDEKLIIQSLSKKDVENKTISFEWIEDNEFRFDGQMYDVKKDLSDLDSLRFLCYLDEHENLIEQLFNKYSNPNKNHSKKFVFAPFLGLFFQKTECIKYLIEIFPFRLENSIQLTINFQEIPTPPPQTEFNFS